MDNRTKSGIALCLCFAFLVAAVLTGLAALNYEFSLRAEMADDDDFSEMDISEWMNYEDLPSHDREIVDRAIEGDRILSPARLNVPGTQEPTTSNLAVRDNGTIYVFQRGLVFIWRSPSGILSMGLLIGALLCFVYISKLQG